jgi:hypothetical protein
VIFVQVHGNHPTPATSVITFYIRHPRGGYGTILNGTLPPALNHYGYVKRISLRLQRRFTYKGQPRSYLSAACATPPGVPVASFLRPGLDALRGGSCAQLDPDQELPGSRMIRRE